MQLSIAQEIEAIHYFTWFKNVLHFSIGNKNIALLKAIGGHGLEGQGGSSFQMPRGEQLLPLGEEI